MKARILGATLAVLALGVLAGCGGSDDVGRLQDEVAQLQAQVQAQQAQIDELEKDTTVVRELEQRVDGLTGLVDDAKAKIDEITGWIDDVGSIFG